MMYYTKLSNYEKEALSAFGCRNRKQSVDNLRIAAQMAEPPEIKEKLQKLADKLAVSVELMYEADYQHDYHTCIHEVEQNLIHDTLEYQLATGDMDTNWPWMNYAAAQVVNAFCTEDCRQSMQRLDVVMSIAVLPQFNSILMGVIFKVATIWEERPEEYKSFVGQCRDIVRRGEFCRRNGNVKYRRYVWAAPDVISEEV